MTLLHDGAQNQQDNDSDGACVSSVTGDLSQNVSAMRRHPDLLTLSDGCFSMPQQGAGHQ